MITGHYNNAKHSLFDHLGCLTMVNFETQLVLVSESLTHFDLHFPVRLGVTWTEPDVALVTSEYLLRWKTRCRISLKARQVEWHLSRHCWKTMKIGYFYSSGIARTIYRKYLDLKKFFDLLNIIVMPGAVVFIRYCKGYLLKKKKKKPWYLTVMSVDV